MKVRGFEPVDITQLKTYTRPDDVILPLRKTKRSSGYDFFAPCDFIINPKQIYRMWSDVKAYMWDDEELLMFIRSSVGIKKGVVLANNVGKIDADYYNNKSNDGNIILALKNTTDNVVKFTKGEGIAQGTFYKYLSADNCNGDDIRSGGIGSTN